jgi:S1-C subfamily serine protease
MKLPRWVPAIAGALAALALVGHAAAEDWAPALSDDDSILHEVDISTLSRSGNIVQSWYRETRRQPRRDPQTGKSYVVSMVSRRDDCEHRKFDLGAFVRRDAKGRVVNAGNVSFRGTWAEIAPGSISEAVWLIACKASEEKAEEPFLDDITSGDWERIGMSGDKKFYISLDFEDVYDLGDHKVLVYSRSDYLDYESVDSLPIRQIVSAGVIDCQQKTFATLGADFYFSPKVRLDYRRIEKDRLKFAGFSPGSFLVNSAQRICAAAKPFEDTAAEGGGWGVGTGWGVVKGYLVTAAHVVAGGKTITVYQNGERIGAARVVAGDPANDLAVLKMTPAAGVRLSVLELSDRPATLGRSVFTLGFPQPDTLGQAIKMTAGEVSSTSGIQDDARFLQISVPVQQGNSGGPVIGWDGKVLGVVEAKLSKFEGSEDGPAPENVNYAVKTAYIRPLLEDLPDLANYTVVKPTAAGDQLVAQARRAVFMLVVEK